MDMQVVRQIMLMSDAINKVTKGDPEKSDRLWRALTISGNVELIHFVVEGEATVVLIDQKLLLSKEEIEVVRSGPVDYALDEEIVLRFKHLENVGPTNYRPRTDIEISSFNTNGVEGEEKERIVEGSDVFNHLVKTSLINRSLTMRDGQAWIAKGMSMWTFGLKPVPLWASTIVKGGESLFVPCIVMEEKRTPSPLYIMYKAVANSKFSSKDAIMLHRERAK